MTPASLRIGQVVTVKCSPVPCKIVGFRDTARGDTHQREEARWIVFVEQGGNYRLGSTRRENATHDR